MELVLNCIFVISMKECLECGLGTVASEFISFWYLLFDIEEYECIDYLVQQCLFIAKICSTFYFFNAGNILCCLFHSCIFTGGTIPMQISRLTKLSKIYVNNNNLRKY